jgi:hypothetical protein
MFLEKQNHITGDQKFFVFFYIKELEKSLFFPPVMYHRLKKKSFFNNLKNTMY